MSDSTAKVPETAEGSSPPIRRSEELSQGMRSRHLTMMGLGSAIGAGLFVGSGIGIRAAGPAVLLSYAIAGAFVVLIMRMLAEMTVAMPTSGSFSVYAEKALGRWAGFLLGWLYWFTIIMVLGVEVTAVASIAHGWWPDVPQWVVALGVVVCFTAINLSNVRKFGEAEFWFAAIKVAAIVGFLVVGALLVAGLLPGTDPVGTVHLSGDGDGFAPRGWSGIAAGLLAVIFAFGGIEIVTIAAAEAEDPGRSVARAARTIAWRILAFYVGSVAILVLVLPWTSPQLATGPFVAVLHLAGMSGAARAMDIVIVIAMLSAFNANIYGTSRMAYSLALRGDGPRALTRVSAHNVPVASVFVSVFFGIVAVGLNWWLPDGILGILLNAVGSTLLVVWLLIVVSELRLRPRIEAAAQQAGAPVRLRMWGYPWLPWIVLIGLLVLVALMLLDRSARLQLASTAVLVLVILSVYLVARRRV